MCYHYFVMILYYLLRCLGLILLGLLIYGQTFQFGFVFDDHYFIVNNPYIKTFSHIHLMWQSFPKTRLIGIYSFAFNYFLGHLYPSGYHIFNFIVHLVCTGLVWVLAQLLFKIVKIPVSRLTNQLPFMIAALFLVHPCQTQAVSYISQRFESMATMFYLATIICYLYARVSQELARKTIFFGFSVTFALLGIFTKEVMITVPVMILAAEWILFPKESNTRLYIVLVAGGFLLYALFFRLLHWDLRLFLRSFPSDSHSGDILTPARYLLTQMRVFLTFLRLLILPIYQNVDYDYQASVDLLHPALTLVGSGTILFFIFLIFKLRRGLPLIAFGLAWILITFSINMAPRANVIFEHKLYLISFGFFLALIALLSAFIHNRGTLLRVLWCIVAALSILSFQRNKVWKEDFTLWNDAVQKSPLKERPYNNRGLAWVDKGNFNQALSDYNKAIQLNPRYVNVYMNRGFLYSQEGLISQAIADFNRAIELDPSLSGAYINRGNAYDKEGLFSQAISDFNKAIDLDQYTAEAYNDRGSSYVKQGNFIKAIADFNKAIDLRGDYANAYYNLGFIYYKQNHYSQAVANYDRAIEIIPTDIVSLNNRAISYYQLKEYDKAWDDVYRIEGLGAAADPNLISALKAVRK